MSRNVFLSVDATGLYTHIDRVLEIVALEAVDLVLTGVQFHVVLNPQHEMHDEVTKITGYQDEQLAGLPTFGDIASALVRFVKDSDLVVANASWDIDLIDAELIRLGMLTLAHHTHHMSDVSSNGLKPNLNIRLNMDKLALLYDCREPVQACSHGWKSCFRLAQMYLKHYRKAKPSMNIIELEKSGACQKFCVQGITFHKRSFHASQFKDSRCERQSGPAATQQANARRAHSGSSDQRAIRRHIPEFQESLH